MFKNLEEITYDFKTLTKIFLFNWRLYLLTSTVTILLVIAIAHFEEPTFRAKTIISIGSESFDQKISSRSFLADLLPGEQTRSPKYNFIPNILGNEFLEILINNSKRKKELERYCKKIKSASLFNRVHLQSEAKNQVATDKYGNLSLQETVICLRSMIYIKKYTYENLSTPAFEISIKSDDPNFSAYLSNHLIKELKNNINDRKNRRMTDVLSMLSKNIRDAQNQSQSAENQRDSYMFKNISQKNIEVDFQLIEILDKNLLDAEETILELEAQKEKLNIKDLQKNEAYLSHKFKNSLEEFLSAEQGFKPNQKLLHEIIEEELARLRLRIVALNSQKSKQIEAMKRRSEYNKNYTRLKSDYEKQVYFASELSISKFKFNLKSLIENEKEDIIVFSKATPESSYTQNWITIRLAIGFVFSIFISSLIIILRNAWDKTIYDSSQLKQYLPTTNVISLSLSTIMRDHPFYVKTNRIPDGLSLMLYQKLSKKNSLTCFFELGSNGAERHFLSSKLMALFCSMITDKDNKTLYVSNKTKPHQRLFSVDRSKTRISSSLKLNHKNIILDQIPEALELSDYSIDKWKQKFNHIFISFQKSHAFGIRYDFSQNVDDYILIGKAGYFKHKDLDEYTSEIFQMKKKCVALIIVD